ncbi:MAG: porphobilinogen synthase [Candidatus Omnitrophota bacterium]|nr:porphobilinogen synthase [Candidatus Omnitrophota bacterium]
MRTNIRVRDLIYPYFVMRGHNKKERIKLFPGVFRFSIDRLISDIAGIRKLGIDKVLLFGVAEEKDDSGITAYTPNTIVAQAIRVIKKEFPDTTVISDVCLCSYTRYGHCGIIKRSPQSIVHSRLKKEKQFGFFIDQAKTLEVLSKIALCHAEAGADWVAPSACARGQVGAIRRAFDANGYKETKILGYSAKFASSFYGPFRNAASSAPGFGDRQSYQLSFADSEYAIKRIVSDVEEGADMVMVKPALGYLDIIKEASLRLKKPLAAYNVSGEYAMVKAYVQRIADSVERREAEKKIVLEILTGIKRAGADLIITYHAKDVARWLMVYSL